MGQNFLVAAAAAACGVNAGVDALRLCFGEQLQQKSFCRIGSPPEKVTPPLLPKYGLKRRSLFTSCSGVKICSFPLRMAQVSGLWQ